MYMGTTFDTHAYCIYLMSTLLVCIIYFNTVRLVNGPTKYEGRVEVYHNGEWGTVCQDGWNLNDAQVVCRQLGFGPAIAARGYASYGHNDYTVIIWLDDVACVGNELTIENCLHNGWRNQNCGLYGDAGVQCSASDGN